jgi:CBS domain-containing protein
MRTVSELLSKRNDQIWSVGPQSSVFDALQVLADHDVGALMVLDKGKLVGVFSERDYTRKIALAGRSSKDTLVADIMTRQVLTVTGQTRTRDCMALMSQKKIRHLPVMDGDTPVGMISIRDIMDDIISDHELTISQLQSYIAS